MEIMGSLTEKKLEKILFNIGNLRALIIGDLCLDVYWKADMKRSELSRETPHHPLPVVEEIMAAGAGGNVATNLFSLNPARVKVLGVTGKDWRGNTLIEVLKDSGLDTNGIVVGDEITTGAYCKPIRKGVSSVEYEDPRIDFSNYEPLPEAMEKQLLKNLIHEAPRADLICVSDQLKFGCITPLIRKELFKLGRGGKTVIADSRDRIGKFTDIILKPNEVEGYRAVNDGKMPGAETTFEEYIQSALKLSKENNARVCMTLGGRGSVYVDGKSLVYAPGHPVEGPIDFCGAGDTFLAAFSCALAAGATGGEGAAFANMAAQVSIKKIGMTGSASPDEIRKRYKEIGL